jgi:hypothetical protein
VQLSAHRPGNRLVELAMGAVTRDGLAEAGALPVLAG